MSFRNPPHLAASFRYPDRIMCGIESRIRLKLIPLCLALIPLAAQTTGTDPVFRVSVDLVQVDVVVSGKNGRHVPNLSAADFEVFEDRNPQNITSFSYVPAGHATGAIMRPATTSQLDPLPEALTPPHMLRQDQVRRTIVLIADDLGLSADAIPGVRNAMKRFVNDGLQPGDIVSIMTTSGGSGSTQQVTNDKRQLFAAIDGVRFRSGRAGQTWYDPVHKIDVASEVDNASNERLNGIRRPFLVAGTINALNYAIDGLKELPGRKAIALFSAGFRQTADTVVERANRASVVIYTIDPRGLVTFFLTAVDYCKPPRCNPRAEESGRETAYRDSQRALDQLARGTGGIFFHDRNDLDQALLDATDDMSDYYLIGYQPQRNDFDAFRHPPRFHRIEVKVRTPGMVVRTRGGFLGVPDPPALQRKPPANASEALRAALLSPFQATGFPVQLSAFYSASVTRDPVRHQHTTSLRAMLALDAKEISFADSPDGRKSLSLEVVGALYGPDNQVVVQNDRIFNESVTPAQMQDLLASGLLYGLDIDLPKPGSYQLRVAAWDDNSKRAASASQFVVIPDFNGADLVLSSLLLSASDVEKNSALTRAGVIGAGNAATRLFSPGTRLTYDSTLFGATFDSKSRKPQVEIQLRLFRGIEHVFTGQFIPLAVPEGNPSEALHITGEIRLPDALPSGEYTVELIAFDRLRKPQDQAVAQSTDLKLMTPAIHKSN